jgi:acetyl-CoA C-acetyltransferase
MEPVVIIAAARTPLGAFNGNFKSTSCPELGGAVIRRVSEYAANKIDAVYMGCVLSAGLGQSPARQAAILAGLGHSINCLNVNKVCGSGMSAIISARNAILSGEIEIAVAGGMENMTNAPYILEKARSGYRFGNGEIIDHMINDGLLDAYEKCVMGCYAEDTAKNYSFTREDQDEYTRQSFFKARKSVETKIFENEITPVTVKLKKSEKVIDTDEIPFSVDISKIPSLKPAFRIDGTITAASASSISDGAAAILLMKESKAEKLGLTPIAKIVACGDYSQDPKLFATAPIGAIKRVLQRSNWNISDIDLFEINEAFAVVAMTAIKEFSIAPEKVNVFGGACAIGHPLGASGARIIVTLLNAMRIKEAKKGLATLCVGGGEGVAITFENLL